MTAVKSATQEYLQTLPLSSEGRQFAEQYMLEETHFTSTSVQKAFSQLGELDRTLLFTFASWFDRRGAKYDGFLLKAMSSKYAQLAKDLGYDPNDLNPDLIIKFLKDETIDSTLKRSFIFYLQCDLKAQLKEKSEEEKQNYLEEIDSFFEEIYEETQVSDLLGSYYFDTDNDGVVDTYDDYPLDARYQYDHDKDGVPNNIDPAPHNKEIWSNLREGEVRYHPADFLVVRKNGKDQIIKKIFFKSEGTTPEILKNIETSVNDYLNTYQEMGEKDVVFNIQLSAVYYGDVELGSFQRSDSMHWDRNASAFVYAHESLHHLTLRDRYEETQHQKNEFAFTPGERHLKSKGYELDQKMDIMNNPVGNWLTNSKAVVLGSDARRLVAEAVPINLNVAIFLTSEWLEKLDSETIENLLIEIKTLKKEDLGPARIELIETLQAKLIQIYSSR